MRTTIAALLGLALAMPAYAGDSVSATRATRVETAPKSDLERRAPTTKPVDGKTLCTYLSPDPNAPSGRSDCVAEREPAAPRATEKTAPGHASDDAAPSIAR